jgi:hypothetical protein
MPKSRPKIHPKNSKNQKKPNVISEPVSITKSKFYWITLTIIAVVAVLGYGIVTSVAIAQIGLILATILTVIGVASYVRLKPSILTAKTRATYLFVGAAVIGFSIWAAMVITLAVSGLGAQSPSFLGSQLFIVASQIIFLAIGAFIGEYLSTNDAFQAFAGKIKQKIG